MLDISTVYTDTRLYCPCPLCLVWPVIGLGKNTTITLTISSHAADTDTDTTAPR